MSTEHAVFAENDVPERRSKRTGRTAAEAAARLRDPGPWHEFTEDVGDASMCVCGVPVLYHDTVFPPGVGDTEGSRS